MRNSVGILSEAFLDPRIGTSLDDPLIEGGFELLVHGTVELLSFRLAVRGSDTVPGGSACPLVETWDEAANEPTKLGRYSENPCN